MIPFLAQARFPAPEFDNYTVPQLQLETLVRDPIAWRVSALLIFLVVSGLCFYRWRSSKAMRLLALAGVVIFGFIFTACPCPVGMFQNLLAAFVHGQVRVASSVRDSSRCRSPVRTAFLRGGLSAGRRSGVVALEADSDSGVG